MEEEAGGEDQGEGRGGGQEEAGAEGEGQTGAGSLVCLCRGHTRQILASDDLFISF